MEQNELWIRQETQIKRIMLHKELLAKGERPDMRPWGGRFDTLHSPDTLYFVVNPIESTP